jgi:thymidylate synthase ThyX
MNVQYVSISPTEKANELGCYALTPELLAATGARYSRNNEGLDSIASKIDFNNTDKSVDGIFKMIDYGHQSIADMTPIALFIDNISLFAAYHLWTLAPTAGGQECSTRYIKIDNDLLISNDILGIQDDLVNDFNKYNQLAFSNYQIALEAWTAISEQFPELTKIPDNLLNSENDKDKKIVARMRRNFAFDRARIYLPLSASTGVMMVQSARAWASISANLQSHHLKELKLLGQEIADKLSIGASRLLKHTKPTETLKKYIENEFDLILSTATSTLWNNYKRNELYDQVDTETYLDTEDSWYPSELISDACKNRTNRYSPFGNVISRLFVRFCWIGISFGEIRDLNRHRTGTKYCPLMPLGFYTAIDQLPDENNELTEAIKNLAYSFKNTTSFARELLTKKIGEYIYFTSLGHQYYFEHTTTADKFLYEMELRTGIGAHYKYAEHCKEVLKLWYKKYPETKGLIFEGSAEPE